MTNRFLNPVSLTSNLYHFVCVLYANCSYLSKEIEGQHSLKPENCPMSEIKFWLRSTRSINSMTIRKFKNFHYWQFYVFVIVLY